MDKDKKRNLFIVLGICLFTVALSAGTYAFLQKQLFNINVNTITQGLDYYINYNKGTNISNGILMSSLDYTDGLNATVTLYKKDNTYDIYGHIYLDVTSISNDLKTEPGFKYTVTRGSTIISEGYLTGTSANSSKLLASNIALSTSNTTYTVYIWLDEDELVNYDLEGASLNASIRCDATMKELE